MTSCTNQIVEKLHFGANYIFPGICIDVSVEDGTTLICTWDACPEANMTSGFCIRATKYTVPEYEAQQVFNIIKTYPNFNLKIKIKNKNLKIKLKRQAAEMFLDCCPELFDKKEIIFID